MPSYLCVRLRAMHVCAIAPPSLLLRLAEAGSPSAREAALETLRISERLRGRRLAVAQALREQGGSVPPDRPGVTANTVFDVAGGEESPPDPSAS